MMNNMGKSVIDILEVLESDNSRLFKEDVLDTNRANDLLRGVFVATSDPYTNYFVNKFKMPPPSTEGLHDDDVVEDFLKVVLPPLSSRHLRGNAAKDWVVTAFARMSARQQKWCLRILLRNLRVGVMETTINKTWPGAIAKFSVQLAETLGSRHEPGKGIVITEDVAYPVRVEPKLDGLRCIAVKKNGVVTMFTRSGSLIETLPTIAAALEAGGYDDAVTDGEVMGSDWNESTSVVMSRKNSKDDSNMTYNVFDAMPLSAWLARHEPNELTDRIDFVSDIVAAVGAPCVVQVVGKTVRTEAELMSFYSSTMEKGYEGIMLKRLSAPYFFKRTDAVLKLKPVQTFEGVVVGHYEGNRGSKREGLWGGFQVLMPNGVITKCGGGFSDKLKAEIDVNPDAWIGRILELEGQPDPLTKDGLSVDGKVRFPVHVRTRDKRDVDPKVLDAYKAWKASQR